jgi:hypothetical protein
MVRQSGSRISTRANRSLRLICRRDADRRFRCRCAYCHATGQRAARRANGGGNSGAGSGFFSDGCPCALTTANHETVGGRRRIHCGHPARGPAAVSQSASLIQLVSVARPGRSPPVGVSPTGFELKSLTFWSNISTNRCLRRNAEGGGRGRPRSPQVIVESFRLNPC